MDGQQRVVPKPEQLEFLEPDASWGRDCFLGQTLDLWVGVGVRLVLS